MNIGDKVLSFEPFKSLQNLMKYCLILAEKEANTIMRNSNKKVTPEEEKNFTKPKSVAEILSRKINTKAISMLR